MPTLGGGGLPRRCDYQEAGIPEGHLGGHLRQEAGDTFSGGRGTRTQILALTLTSV